LSSALGVEHGVELGHLAWRWMLNAGQALGFGRWTLNVPGAGR